MARNSLTEHDISIRQAISQNLKRLTANMTQDELAEKTGIPQSTLSGYFACRSTPNAGRLQKIADALGVDKSLIDPRFSTTDEEPSAFSTRELALVQRYRSLDTRGQDWVDKVVTREQERYQEFLAYQSQNSTGDDVRDEEYASIEETHEKYNKIIPLYGRVSAGKGVTAIAGYDNISGPNGADMALIVEGDSMEPVYEDGEIIYIRQQPQANNGQIVVLQVQEDSDFEPTAYLKKLKDDGSDYYTLISLNDRYEPLKYHKRDCRILGVVLNKQQY